MPTLAKLVDFRDYQKLRDLGDYTPPHRKALAGLILARRAERIAMYELENPEFKEHYDNSKE